jgi:hypothetical protein
MMEKNTHVLVGPKVLFLIPERLEFVQLVRSLFLPLSKRNVSMKVILIETNETYESVQKEAEKILLTEQVPFQYLADYNSETALGILREEKPLLVVTDNDQEPERRAFVLTAQKLNISTLVLRETVASSKNANFRKILTLIAMKLNELPRISKKYLFYYKSALAIEPISLINFPQVVKDFIHQLSNPTAGESADYILTNTSEDAESLKKFCPHARRILAVGNPRFDEVLNLTFSECKKIRQEIREMFNIPSNKKIILLLSSSQVEHGQWSEKQKMTVNQEILAVLEKLRDEVDVIIKLHPVERNIFPLIWKPDYDSFIRVSNFDLLKFILASDLVISWYSTAMINVVLSRKPLIALDFSGDRAHGNVLLSIQAIVEQGAALEALNVTDLFGSLSAILSDDQLRNSLKQSQDVFHSTYLKTMDGYSASRIAEMIAEIVGCKEK